MIADGDSVSIFAKVVNNGLGSIKGFLAVGNPVFFIASIYQFFECIMITVLFTGSMEMKLIIFP